MMKHLQKYIENSHSIPLTNKILIITYPLKLCFILQIFWLHLELENKNYESKFKASKIGHQFQKFIIVAQKSCLDFRIYGKKMLF